MAIAMTTVSVIISAHNAERYLSEAVDTVLRQTFTDFTLIVVNDGSTDRTEGIVRSYGDRIICVSQEKRGPAAARNRAPKIAQGQMIAFQVPEEWARAAA